MNVSGMKFRIDHGIKVYAVNIPLTRECKTVDGFGSEELNKFAQSIKDFIPAEWGFERCVSYFKKRNTTIYTDIIVDNIDYSDIINNMIKNNDKESMTLDFEAPKRVGTGAFRDVFELNNKYVVKIASYQGDESCNIRETIISAAIHYNKYVPDYVKQHFLNVKFVSKDGRILIAEKCDENHSRNIVYEIDTMLSLFHFGYIDDVVSKNVMLKAGTDIPVIVDLGNVDTRSVLEGIRYLTSIVLLSEEMTA